MRSNFPHGAEKKLRTIIQFYSNLKLKRARKNVNNIQLSMFELTAKEKKNFLKELVNVALAVNKAVFDSWSKSIKLSETQLKKEWVKSVFNIVNDTKEFEKLKQLKLERQMELAKKLKIDIFDSKGNISKAKLQAIKTNVYRYRNSEEIRTIIAKLESNKFSSEDIKRLKEWQDRRNELIARNETGNLYAQEVKDLMIENNLEQYVWRTMKDNRVRESHAERDGKVFSINDSLLPGEDFNCRCWAEPLKNKK